MLSFLCVKLSSWYSTSNAACTLAENRPKLAEFLIGRSFLGVSIFGRIANQQEHRPKSSLVLIKILPKIGWNNQSEQCTNSSEWYLPVSRWWEKTQKFWFIAQQRNAIMPAAELTQRYVDCLQQFPALWDSRTRSYSNKDAKNAAWQSLANLIGVTVLEAQTIHKTNRTYFQKVCEVIYYL